MHVQLKVAEEGIRVRAFYLEWSFGGGSGGAAVGRITE